MKIIYYLEDMITRSKIKKLKKIDLFMPEEIRDFILRCGLANQIDTIKREYITFYEDRMASKFFHHICERFSYLFEGPGKWEMHWSQADFWGSTVVYFTREQSQ